MAGYPVERLLLLQRQIGGIVEVILFFNAFRRRRTGAPKPATFALGVLLWRLLLRVLLLLLRKGGGWRRAGGRNGAARAALLFGVIRIFLDFDQRRFVVQVAAAAVDVVVANFIVQKTTRTDGQIRFLVNMRTDGTEGQDGRTYDRSSSTDFIPPSLEWRNKSQR